MTRAAGLIEVKPDERDLRFAERRRRWRTRAQGVYARHDQVQPHAGVLFGVMFDRGVRLVGPIREYAMQADGLPIVRITADEDASRPWSWVIAGGRAEGRGLYELWAWRFDCVVDQAADEIWATIHQAGAPA